MCDGRCAKGQADMLLQSRKRETKIAKEEDDLAAMQSNLADSAEAVIVATLLYVKFEM